ncbi:MAG: flagellar hook-basal body protein [Acidobacteriaceae bacterium]|nr:flagellar hook-basal body protein [Acidobacteriaceae bacterium]
MEALTAIAASGMRSRTETLDLLANNIANAATPGFKEDGESYNLFFGDSAWQGVNENRPANPEMPLIQKNWVNFAQGTISETGNASDLALTTPGFFVVQSADGTPLYTRSGHFRISSTGVLQTQEGYQVQGTDGKPVQLDPAKTFTVSSSGQISQANVAVANIQVVNVDSLENLIKHGGPYFALAPSGKTAPAANTEVVQGKLEQANVEPTHSAVKLVGVLRQFEMMQRAIRIASEMGKEAVEQVAKI